MSEMVSLVTGDCVGGRDGALGGESYGDGTGDGTSLELSCDPESRLVWSSSSSLSECCCGRGNSRSSSISDSPSVSDQLSVSNPPSKSKPPVSSKLATGSAVYKAISGSLLL